MKAPYGENYVNGKKAGFIAGLFAGMLLTAGLVKGAWIAGILGVMVVIGFSFLLFPRGEGEKKSRRTNIRENDEGDRMDRLTGRAE